MIDQYRKLFNAQFTEKINQNSRMILLLILIIYLLFDWGNSFISKDLKNQIIEGSNQVIAFIQSNNFKAQTNH
jgi:hypothetical protein